MKNLLLLFFCVYSVYAIVTPDSSSEACLSNLNPDLNVQDIGALCGKWYEVSNYGTPGSPVCAIFHYTLVGANTFSLFVNHTSPGPTYVGSGLGALSTPGIMIANVIQQTASGTSVTEFQTWTILGTDYLNYMAAFTCHGETPVVSILVRNPNPPQSVWNTALAAATSQLPASYQLVGCST